MKMDIARFVSRGKSDAKVFLLNLETYFLNNPSECSTDAKKIAKAIACTSETVQTWYYGIENRATLDWAEFKDQFDIAYGKSNESAEAVSKIKQLKQTGSAQTYTIEFQRYATLTGWNNKSLVDQFKTGLKDSVQTLLINKGLNSDDIRGYYKAAISIDNEIFAIHGRGRPSNYSEKYDKDKRDKNRGRDDDGSPSKKLRSNNYRDHKSNKEKSDDDDKINKSKNNEVECYYCKKKGHLKKDCYKLKRKKKEEEGKEKGEKSGKESEKTSLKGQPQ